MKTAEQTRRELFEAGINIRTRMRNEHGDYVLGEIRDMWAGFNAALDAAVIELPGPEISYDIFDNGHAAGVDSCRTAIESTNLGIKVK